MKNILRSWQTTVGQLMLAAGLFLGLILGGPSQIVPPPTPPVVLSGTNLIWRFTNGFPYEPFLVVATTNFWLPARNWDVVSTNQFDQWGCCTLVLPIQPDRPCRFYRIALPVL